MAFDRRRQGEKTSNKDGQSIRDEAARRAKLKRWPHPLPVRGGTTDSRGHHGLSLFARSTFVQRDVGAPSTSKKPQLPVLVMLIFLIDFYFM